MATRQLRHTRRVEMLGFDRDDGLFELEGRLTDTKPYDFTPISGGRNVPAGTPVHAMFVNLVFDNRLVVQEVVARIDASPYPVCPEASSSLQAIKGLRMASGWTREVRSRLGGAQSCTHLMELLLPMATAAHQTLGTRSANPQPKDANGRPLKIDSCYAYADHREIVRMRWPEHHRATTES